MTPALRLLDQTLAADAVAAVHMEDGSDFLKHLFSDGLKAAKVHAKDLAFINKLVSNVDLMVKLAALLKHVIEHGKVSETMSYSVYTGLLALLVASIARLSRGEANEPWVRDVVAALKHMFAIFHGDDIIERLAKHKKSPFYAKLKALYVRIKAFFARLWQAFKKLIKRPRDFVVKGEIDIGKLYGAGLSHLAALDDLNSKLGGPRVVTEHVKGLPHLSTSLRSVQMQLLEHENSD